MNFHERLKSLSPKKYQEIFSATARIGNPQEIFDYINAMPICCHESTGLLHTDYEVRIDSRFLVICHRKHLSAFTVDQIKTFYVSACDNDASYRFGINRDGEFVVNARYAHALYQKLLALCPGFFRPMPDVRQININENRNLSFDSQNITVWKQMLFNKTKTEQVIPLRNIRACYQTYNADSDGNAYYLNLRMKDGTEQKIWARDNLCCFQIAQILKAFIPELVYEYPAKPAR